jgi:thiaminase/transcriptional activator TenA
MPVADLPLRHPAAWARATRHPFLSAVGDGTVPEAAFDVWLVQDYRFVGDVLRFQGRLLGRAPRTAQAVLARGAVALVDELAWFEEQAARRGLDLRADPLPATVAYAGLLERLGRVDSAVALAMLWAVERVYLDAWSYAAPGAPAYRQFVAHWTTPQFADYVAAVAAAADEALARHGDAPDVDRYCAAVLDAEAAFWDMAWQGPNR